MPVFIPFASAEEELIVEFDTDLEPDSWDSMGFQEKARRECRIELTADQSVYAVVVEPMAIEMFDGIFSGQVSVSQLEYVKGSKINVDEGGGVNSQRFDLPSMRTEDELYYENYYFVIVGYGEYPVDWCDGGDLTASVNVKIYKVEEEINCCLSMIYVPMGLLGLVILLNVKRKPVL
ncbi:MAG: hypothetical protein ACMUIG_07790 [Thermoplasmatota archaeon]